MEDRYRTTNVGRSSGAAVSASVAIKPSERSGRVRYAIRDIVVLAEKARAAGRTLLNLNIGDPNLYDFQTPAHVIEATHQAMLAGHNGYAASAGIEEALDAIRREAHANGIRNIQDIFVTSGVSEGIEIAMASLIDTGDNILIPSPGYPLYEATLAKLGCDPLSYELDEENGWQPDVQRMAGLINERTRGIVIINPNNPTGAVIHRDVLTEILDLAARHGLMVFSDEIYNKLIFDQNDYVPAAALAPDQPVLTLNGMSKSYCVPGFRIGWGILTGQESQVADYREAMAKMLRVRLCANHPAQYAIRPALDGDQSHIAVMVEKLKSRRDLIVSMLNSIPKVHCFPPQAAFYAFPRLDIARSDDEFVKELIMETGVVVVPGSGFGQRPGTRHFRLVFLPPEETLKQAIGRIGEFARKWQ
jgi:alanine-synthesizing transaminase